MANDPHALKAGTSIAGYNIVRVLGAGGFGITYEADSPFTGKRVAIKEFFPRGIASREGNTRIVYSDRDAELVQWALKRFESSTLDQCRLKHPNIVDVIHYVKDHGTGYMIMEYVEGQTLDAWLRARPQPPSPEELRPLIEPVLSALEYLHAKKLIHRDVAPDNIMVRPDSRPIIIDFGAVKLIEQETQARSKTEKSFMVAKQFYSPPEQIQADGELDARADIYATAAVLYRAFSGQPPVNAEDRMQKLAYGKLDPIKPLAAIAPKLPLHIAAAIDRALSFNAEARQPTIAALREALSWDDGAGRAATRAIPRSLSPKTTAALPYNGDLDEPRQRRSRLPWLLPLAGLAAITAAVIGYNVNLFAPVKKDLTVTPPPKMDTVVVPQTPVFTPPPATPEQAVGPQPDPSAIQRQAYESALQENTRVALENFLAAHPQSAHTEQARQHLRTIILQDQATLVSNIQTELERVGCGRNFAAGEWTPDTRDAARNFLTKIDLHSVTSTVPTDSLLKVLRGTASRVCPLECPAGQHARGDVCVALLPPPAATPAPQAQPQKTHQPVRDVQKKQPPPANPAAREDPGSKSGCLTKRDRNLNARC